MKRNVERGATLVEAALVLLLLLTLIFAVIDFGRALHVYQTMTDAAREGARYAVAPYHPFGGATTLPTDAQIQAHVNTFLDAASISNRTVNVSVVTQTVGIRTVSYKRVQVTSAYNSFIVPALNITLRTQATMRNEMQTLP